jgi:hypothetical protein
MRTETATSNRIHDLATLELRLAQVRDELRLKLHLARQDARDQWDQAEEKWRHFEARAGDLRQASEGAAEDLWSGLKSLGHEVSEGYEKIRRAL